jgi:hypothetical protein
MFFATVKIYGYEWSYQNITQREHIFKCLALYVVGNIVCPLKMFVKSIKTK